MLRDLSSNIPILGKHAHFFNKFVPETQIKTSGKSTGDNCGHHVSDADYDVGGILLVFAMAGMIVLVC